MSRDFEEFIAALNAHEVRYVVIVAHAVALHARPRATKDLDVFVEPSAENAERLLKALRDFFGGADLGYTIEDILEPRWVLQIGVPPVRIDLLSAVTGISDFRSVWAARVHARFGTVDCEFLGSDDLIRSKEAADRPQDRADLVVLRKARARRKPQPPHDPDRPGS